MKIADIMTRPAATIPATSSVTAAAVRMRDLHAGMLCVLDAQSLVGVLTDRDIVVRCVALDRAARSTSVRDIMSRDPLICFETQRIEDAAAIMGDHQLRHLPVCDNAARLVGLLSVDRIAEDYSEHLAGETLGEIVETRGPLPPDLTGLAADDPHNPPAPC